MVNKNTEGSSRSCQFFIGLEVTAEELCSGKRKCRSRTGTLGLGGLSYLSSL